MKLWNRFDKFLKENKNGLLINETMNDTVHDILVNQELIYNTIGEAALYEQLAEECNELAQASLKKVRKLRNENPTPLDNKEIDANIVEEITDVIIVMDILDLSHDYKIYSNKCKRWSNRLTGKDDYENHTS